MRTAVLALTLLAACSTEDAETRSVTCQSVGETEARPDGVEVTAYDAWDPAPDTVAKAELCDGAECGPVEFSVVNGMARVDCGALYVRNGQVIDEPADFAVFTYKDQH